MNVVRVKPLLSAIPDDSVRQLVGSVLENYCEHILPVIEHLPAGVTHGDLNENNLLVTPEEPDVISGLIDFNDIVHAPYVADLGVCLAYLMLVVKGNPATSVLPIIRGYVAERRLQPAERDTLFYWALSRLAQSIAYGFETYRKDPENEYLMVSCRPAMVVLRKLVDEGKENLCRLWANTCDE